MVTQSVQSSDDGGVLMKTGEWVRIKGDSDNTPRLVLGEWAGAQGTAKELGPLLILAGSSFPEWAYAGRAQGFPTANALIPKNLCFSDAAATVEERRREAARTALDGVTARAKARARARWFRKHGPTLARLACGVGASLWAILYIVVATR